MNSQQVLYLLFGIITFNFLLELFLDFLNSKRWKNTLPDILAPYYDAEAYKKSQQYHKANKRLAIFKSILNYVTLAVVLMSGTFGWLSESLKPYIENPIALALAFFGILIFISSLLNLPFSIYHTFVIEEKFGFNRTSAKTFVTDLIKSLLITILIGGILGFVLLWIIFELKENFWIYAWILVAGLTVFINIFYTSLILPIFNKLSPLPEGELRNAIESYADKNGFSVDNIYVINGSKRSTKANAFFSGMAGKKKIVLYDTLIEQHTTDELIAILAHEVGHYKHKHIIKGVIISLIQLFVMLWLMSLLLFNTTLSQALGSPELAIHLNLIAIGMLFEPVSLLIGLLMNMLSRKHEFQADKYAVTTANKQAFKDALIRLSVENLSNLDPHPTYVFFHYSHPPLLSRLRSIG